MDITEEREIKHRRVVEYIESHGLDAVLLSRRCNFSWYTCGAHNYVNHGCDAGNSWLLVDRQGACVLTSNIESPRLGQEELAETGIEVREFPYYDPAGRETAFSAALGRRKIAADAPLAGFALPGLDRDFDRLRWTLTEREMVRYRSLCTDTVAAMEFVARDAEPGCTEHELAGMLSGAIRCTGASPWVLLVAGDDRIAKFRHPLPTDLVVERMFMLVACAERGGLIAACTRLVSFGALSQELTDKHRAVATVDTALIASTRPGRKLCDIYAQARAAYKAAGFPDEWQLHHQGGSCGYLPREVVANPREQTAALENQAFAWNPSITGTKCEDTMLCTAQGPELLNAPSDWPALETEWNGVRIARPGILVR